MPEKRLALNPRDQIKKIKDAEQEERNSTSSAFAECPRVHVAEVA
jgi:hypothetical protein